jgi:Transposase, Mutator family
VIDGGKGIREAIRSVFGVWALVQRCQVHKLRNVLQHLPERQHASVRAAQRGAWSGKNEATAKRKLNNLARQLEARWPSAAASLREGLDETLTVLALGTTGGLHRTPAFDEPDREPAVAVQAHHTARDALAGRQHGTPLGRHWPAGCRHALQAHPRTRRPETPHRRRERPLRRRRCRHRQQRSAREKGGVARHARDEQPVADRSPPPGGRSLRQPRAVRAIRSTTTSPSRCAAVVDHQSFIGFAEGRDRPRRPSLRRSWPSYLDIACVVAYNYNPSRPPLPCNAVRDTATRRTLLIKLSIGLVVARERVSVLGRPSLMIVNVHLEVAWQRGVAGELGSTPGTRQPQATPPAHGVHARPSQTV